MWRRLAVRLTVSLLRSAELSLTDRSLLTATILDRLVALPASAILKTDTDGTLIVNNKRVDVKMASVINKSAIRVLNERAFKIALEQTRFAAIEIGVFQGLNTDQNMFAKAALWQAGELKKIIDELAGNAVSEEDLDDDD